MTKKKLMIATTDIRKFVTEVTRLAKLGAEFTEQCVAIKGLPLIRATMLINSDIDVGTSAVVTVYGSVEEVQEEKKEEPVVEEKKTTRKARTQQADSKE